MGTRRAPLTGAPARESQLLDAVGLAPPRAALHAILSFEEDPLFFVVAANLEDRLPVAVPGFAALRPWLGFRSLHVGFSTISTNSTKGARRDEALSQPQSRGLSEKPARMELDIPSATREQYSEALTEAQLRQGGRDREVATAALELARTPPRPADEISSATMPQTLDVGAIPEAPANAGNGSSRGSSSATARRPKSPIALTAQAGRARPTPLHGHSFAAAVAGYSALAA